jgi:hypothetical protein
VFGVKPFEHLDAELRGKLTRAQCLAIIDAPPRTKLLDLAEKYNVRVSLIRHVRYNCKWLKGALARPKGRP